MKAGICTIALRRYDLFKALDLAKEAGFQGVEIWGRPEHTPEAFSEDYWLKVKDKLSETELEVSNFGSYVNPAWGDYDQKREDAFKISAIIGAKMMRVWCGNKEPKDADEGLWQRMIDAYKDLSKASEDRGITLAIEMHGGTLCVNPEGALRMVESVDSPALRLNYQIQDPVHPNIEHDISVVGPYIVNIHAQNYQPSKDDPSKNELVPIEDGCTDYLKVLKLLKPYGFNGYIEVEFLAGEFVSEEVQMESLHKDAAYLRKIVTAGVGD